MWDGDVGCRGATTAAAMALRASDKVMRSFMMGRETVVLWCAEGFAARYTIIVAGG